MLADMDVISDAVVQKSIIERIKFRTLWETPNTKTICIKCGYPIQWIEQAVNQKEPTFKPGRWQFDNAIGRVKCGDQYAHEHITLIC